MRGQQTPSLRVGSTRFAISCAESATQHTHTDTHCAEAVFLLAKGPVKKYWNQLWQSELI